MDAFLYTFVEDPDEDSPLEELDGWLLEAALREEKKEAKLAKVDTPVEVKNYSQQLREETAVVQLDDCLQCQVTVPRCQVGGNLTLKKISCSLVFRSIRLRQW